MCSGKWSTNACIPPEGRAIHWCGRCHALALIERYTLPEMGELWTDRAKYQSWLDVEVAACEANCSLGRVPEAAMQDIRTKAAFEPERILEIEAEVRHDVIAFLTNVNEHVGDAPPAAIDACWR